MPYVWQRWLADELRAEVKRQGLIGVVRIVEVAGWKNRGRPASTGNFDPKNGVVTHHTASRSSASSPAPTLGLCIRGRSDLPGPIAHVVTGYDGTIHVIAAGRANVNGPVKRGSDGFPLGADANALAMGNEVDTNGSQQVPNAQRQAMLVFQATVLRHYGQPVDRIRRHHDINPGKPDIGQFTTQEIQTWTKPMLAGVDRPTPTPPEDDDVKHTYFDLSTSGVEVETGDFIPLTRENADDEGWHADKAGAITAPFDAVLTISVRTSGGMTNLLLFSTDGTTSTTLASGAQYTTTARLPKGRTLRIKVSQGTVTSAAVRASGWED